MIAGHEIYWASKQFKKKDMIIFNGVKYNASEINILSNQLANALIKQGLQKADRVAVLLKNSLESVITLFGIQKAGMIYVGLNERYSSKELTKIILDCKPNIIFTSEDFKENIKSTMKSVRFLVKVIGIRWQYEDFITYENLIDNSKKSPPNILVNKNDVMRIQYTSGTTGNPKGITYSWEQHQHRLNNFFLAFESSLDVSDSIVHMAPLTHASGNFLHPFFIRGATNIISNKFNTQKLQKMISEKKVTYLFLVPTMIKRLIEDLNKKKFDLSSLKRIFYGASPIPAKVLKEGIENFGCIFRQHYGMTEVPQPVTVLYPHEHKISKFKNKNIRLSSCGRASINVNIKITNEFDKKVKIGQVGEICIEAKGVASFKYWNTNINQENETIKNGWFHTNDLGWMDGDGYLYLTGRKSDMIISGGFNIYPNEVESIIQQLKEISEVVVIGIPNKIWGEIVTAFVVFNKGMKLSESQILDFLSKQIASYKKPKKIHTVKELPRNNNRKIDRNSLKKNWRKFITK